MFIYWVLQQGLIREYQAEIKYLKQNKEKAAEVTAWLIFLKFIIAVT